ncbi:MAG: hypothetical protein AAFX44_16560 [Pseudomonadota bacterium]
MIGSNAVVSLADAALVYSRRSVAAGAPIDVFVRIVDAGVASILIWLSQDLSDASCLAAGTNRFAHALRFP